MLSEDEGEKGMGPYSAMHRVLVGKDEKVLDLDGDDGYKAVCLNLMPLHCTQNDD